MELAPAIATATCWRVDGTMEAWFCAIAWQFRVVHNLAVIAARDISWQTGGTVSVRSG